MNIQDNFLLEFKDLEEKSIRNLLDRIEEIKGKPLNEFRLMDLTYHNGNQISPGIGVYIFRNCSGWQDIIYVFYRTNRKTS